MNTVGAVLSGNELTYRLSELASSVSSFDAGVVEALLFPGQPLEWAFRHRATDFPITVQRLEFDGLSISLC